MTKRINLISGPRNISTALMYAFDNRGDTSVVDEPMYAYYLKTSGADHPAKEAILEALPQDLEEVLEGLFFCDVDHPFYFIKGMAHHYYKTDLNFLKRLENVFLIRDPKQLIASFSKVINNPRMQDIGLKRECEIFQYLLDSGRVPVVLDSGELLKDPFLIINNLCDALDIPFTRRMLHWEPGPRMADGVWAAHWYTNVHRSTGFIRQTSSQRSFPAHLVPLLDEAKPYYERLYRHALKV